VIKNSSQYRNIFIPLLRQLRLSKNLTQAEIAARLQVPQSYVSKYETGERRLDFVETVLVCQALNVGIEEFAKRFSKELRRGTSP